MGRGRGYCGGVGCRDHAQSKKAEMKIELDTYIGSGTTMVVCNELGLKCFGMEIDSKYCQVIIDRMLKLDPTLEIKRNGQPYKNRETTGDGQ